MTLYTTTQEWQCPAGVTSVAIVLVGGGGHGASGEAEAGSSNGHGGQGGGEGVQNSTNVAVTPGSYYTITIGGAGQASSFAGETAAAGTDRTAAAGTANGSDGDAGYSTGVTGTAGESTTNPQYYGGAGGTGYGAGGGGGAGGIVGTYGYRPVGGHGAPGCLVITYTLPVSGFSATPVSGYTPVHVEFTNESSGATAYHWYFGDGSDTTDATPAHHDYTLPGKYQVILTATNAQGFDIETKADYIVVAGPPLAHGFIIMGDRLRGV